MNYWLWESHEDGEPVSDGVGAPVGGPPVCGAPYRRNSSRHYENSPLPPAPPAPPDGKRLCLPLALRGNWRAFREFPGRPGFPGSRILGKRR